MSLTKSVVWGLLASLVQQGGNFLLFIFVSRTLGQEVFGRFSAVQNSLLAIAGVGQLGLGYCASKYIAEYLENDKCRVGRIVRLCKFCNCAAATAVSISVYVFSDALSGRVFGSESLAPLFRIGSAFLLLHMTVQFQSGVLSGFHAFKVLSQCTIAGSTLALLFGITGAFVEGPSGALAGLSLGAMIRWALQTVAISRVVSISGVPRDPLNYWAENPVLWRFALPGLLSTLTAVPALWSYNVFLAGVPDGFSQLAQFAVALSYKNALLMLPMIVNSTAMSRFNHYRGLGDTVRYGMLFKKNLFFTVAITIAFSGVAAFTSVHLLSLFGASFRSAVPTFHLLLVAAVPEAVTIAIHQIVQSKAKMWEAVLWVNLPRDSIIVIVGFMLAPSLGALGIGIAFLSGSITGMLSSVLLVWKLGVHAK